MRHKKVLIMSLIVAQMLSFSTIAYAEESDADANGVIENSAVSETEEPEENNEDLPYQLNENLENVPLFTPDSEFAEASAVTGSAIQVTRTYFTVDESVIGGGLVVSIPTNLSLSYDEGTEAFVGTGYVYTKGVMGSTQYLEVRVEPTIFYQNIDVDGVWVAGHVNFGAEGLEIWTAEDAKASMRNLDKRPVTIVVPKSAIDTAGTYEAELTFYMELVDFSQE